MIKEKDGEVQYQTSVTSKDWPKNLDKKFMLENSINWEIAL